MDGVPLCERPQLWQVWPKKMDEDDPTYNIRIDGKLRVTALKDIELDEELFLHYNLRDKHDNDESDDDDESAADNESDDDDESNERDNKEE